MKTKLAFIFFLTSSTLLAQNVTNNDSAIYYKQVQKTCQNMTKDFGYTFNAWIKAEEYFRLEGFWLFGGGHVYSDCIILNYLDISNYFSSTTNQYGLGFFRNKTGAIDIYECPYFHDHGYLDDATLKCLKKIEGSVKKDGTKYIVYLKKYDYTFNVTFREDGLESALDDYYSNKKSLRELQQYVLDTEKPKPGNGISYSIPEAYFSGNKCKPDLYIQFWKKMNSIPEQILSIDLATEQTGYKFNFAGNLPRDPFGAMERLTVQANETAKSNKDRLQRANKEFMALEEGELVCLITPSEELSILKEVSEIAAYVEKYNASKSKLQIRIHMVSSDSRMNFYEGIPFKEGDIIWINLPMTDSKKYWMRCKGK